MDFQKICWTLASALSGAFVAAGSDKELKTPQQRFWCFMSGIACAFWLAGPLASYFGVTDAGAVSAVTFGVAMFWQKVVAKLSMVLDNLPSIGIKK